MHTKNVASQRTAHLSAYSVCVNAPLGHIIVEQLTERRVAAGDS